MASIREQIQDGQHLANKIIKQIKLDVDSMSKKKIALANYHYELYYQLEKLFHPVKPDNNG